MARRDREQLISTEGQDDARLALLDELTRPRPCRVCGKRINAVDGDPLTVCSGCGGRKRQKQLERADREAALEEQRKAALLDLAGISTTKEEAMNDPIRHCKSCNKKLRRDNAYESCWDCRSSGKADDAMVSASAAAPSEEGGAAPAPRRAKRDRDVRKDFKTVAAALGEDPDALVDDFCSAWLDRVRDAVRRKRDETDNFKTSLET